MIYLIHKVPNDITVDEWAIIIGGDSQGCQRVVFERTGTAV
jgi:hypothetical protein